MGKRTGFSPADKHAILERDSWQCVVHGPGCPSDSLVVHHRAGRGMGGSRAANRLSNGLTVCSQANVDMESDAGFAELARERGWKISKFADPEKERCWVPFYGAWMWLTDDGDYAEYPPDE